MSGIAVFVGLCTLIGLGLALAFIDALIDWTPRATINPKRQMPSDCFTCSHCGTGPWHNSWSPEFDPPLCPDCTGAD